MDPGLQGSAVSPVLLMPQDSDFLRIRIDPFARSIRRAVIDDQELERHSRPSHFRKQPLDEGTNPCLLVIHGDYDADAFSVAFRTQRLSLTRRRDREEADRVIRRTMLDFMAKHSIIALLQQIQIIVIERRSSPRS